MEAETDRNCNEQKKKWSSIKHGHFAHGKPYLRVSDFVVIFFVFIFISLFGSYLYELVNRFALNNKLLIRFSRLQSEFSLADLKPGNTISSSPKNCLLPGPPQLIQYVEGKKKYSRPSQFTVFNAQ